MKNMENKISKTKMMVIDHIFKINRKRVNSKKNKEI